MRGDGDYALALDVGGTFTDVILAERSGAGVWTAKCASTPARPEQGFFEGVEKILSRSGVAASAVSRVLHGSTVATNAILEGKGARTALVTTAGFRHVLEIGRAEIPREANLYGWVKPKRIVPPRDVFELPERVRADGSVARPLDEAAVAALAESLAERDFRALAIVFLHAYANPAHERRAREIIAAQLPELEISISSEVLPVFREYERTTATALNAAVQPVVGRYVGALDEGLRRRGLAAPLFIMKSNGGLCPPEEAARGAVHLALSGPAAGARGAAYLGRLAGFDNLLTIDMGGTSADVALIRQGQPETTTAGRIGEHPLALPIVDIHTIGAGGGSIASVSPEGAIRVGPESAGASPGPAAYGQGGTRPTATDANLLLGRVPPHLLDGEVPLHPERARAAVETEVAGPAGLSAEEAAGGIVEIVDGNMVGTLKVVSVERGLDPRDFALAAFGGAGPVHGGRLLRLLGARHLLVPRHPGILCAIGLLTTDLRYDFVRTLLQRAGAYDVAAMAATFRELAEEADARLERDGVPPERRRLILAADLRYRRQGVELVVPFPSDTVDEPAIERLVQDFHALHERLYTFANPAQPVEIVNLRVQATGETDKVALPEVPAAAGRRPEPSAERCVSFGADGAVATPVYRRESLLADQEIEGPAIVDQLDSTTVVHPGQVARADRFGNLLIEEAAP